MRKLFCIVLICALALSLAACGSSGSSGDGTADVKNVSQSDIIGNYVEQNTGAALRVEDEYVYWTTTQAKYWSEPYESAHNYKIEGNQLTTTVDEEGWGAFDIKAYGSGYSLSNDVYTFIPYEDYYSFENADLNKVGDKAIGENASVTVTGVEFADSIDILEYVTPTWVNSFKDDFILDAPDGQCFVKVQISLENAGKETLAASDALSVSLVYDHSYVFNSYETTGNSLIAEPMNYCYVDGSSAHNAGDLNISPLSSKTLTVVMLCPTAVMENTDKPLCAAFSVVDANGNPSVFAFDLR